MGSTDIKIIQKGILGRLGRVFSNYAGIEENCINSIEVNSNNIYKELKKGVPSVPSAESVEISKESETPVPSVPTIDIEGDTMCFEDTSSSLQADTILKMPLSEFKQGGYLLRIRCRYLGGEEVFLASTEKEAAIGRAEGLVVYLADELINLIRSKATPAEVRAVHMVKSSLGGTLLQKE